MQCEKSDKHKIRLSEPKLAFYWFEAGLRKFIAKIILKLIGAEQLSYW